MKPFVDRCPLCGQSAEFTFLESHADQKVEYRLYECRRCFAQFWDPLKNPGSGWYEKDERYKDRGENPFLEPNKNHLRVIQFLKPRIGKVLDVGCGTGNFLAYARREGWDPYGFDFDPQAVEAAKHIMGLARVEVSNFLSYEARHPEERYDLITLFDVFEHIDNHREVIERIKSLLRVKGYLALSTPYRDGARWLQPHDLPPRHLTRWNRRAMKIFLEQNGFKVLLLERRSEGPMYLVMRLRFRFGQFLTFNLVGKLKSRTRESGVSPDGRSPENMVSFVHLLAKIKDCFIFGLPAIIIYLGYLFTPARFTTLLTVAQKK